MTATKGSWALVRMRRGQPGKPQWLLIKHRDEYAAPGSDVAAENLTSVATGRTMEEIAEGKRRVWRSNRAEKNAPSQARGATPDTMKKTEDSAYGRLMALRRR